MDTIMKKISEIESASESIVKAAAARKTAFAKDMEAQTAEFDARLEEDTNAHIQKLRSEMETNMKKQLEKQAADAQNLLKQMESSYQSNHSVYASQLFAEMIKE